MRQRVFIAGAILSFALVMTGKPLQDSGTSVGPASARGRETPHLPDGTINLGFAGAPGVWELTYIENLASYVVGNDDRRGNRARHTPGSAAEPQIPFLPWAAAVYDYNVKTEAKYDPGGYCLPPMGPRLLTNPYPMVVIQSPELKRVFFLFEAFHVWREIYMDGRAPQSREGGRRLGYSVGHYEDSGQTLVIDVTGFNEGSWLDSAGHPHTDQLHIVERFTRPMRDSLHYEAVIDDPGAYTSPWIVGWDLAWWHGGQLDEYVCEENNQYIHSVRDDFGQPLFPAP